MTNSSTSQGYAIPGAGYIEKCAKCECDSPHLLERGGDFISSWLFCKRCQRLTRFGAEGDERQSKYKRFCEEGAYALDDFRFVEAQRAYGRALEIYPDSPDALWGMLCVRYGAVMLRDERQEDLYRPVYCYFDYDAQSPFEEDPYVARLRAAMERWQDFREIYEPMLQELKRAVEELRREFVTDPEFDVFLSCQAELRGDYAEKRREYTEEYTAARELYFELVKKGVKVCFPSKNRQNGEWDDLDTFRDMLRSRFMILVGGGEQNEENMRSPWLKSEWMRWLRMMEQGIRPMHSLHAYNVDPRRGTALPLELRESAKAAKEEWKPKSREKMIEFFYKHSMRVEKRNHITFRSDDLGVEIEPGKLYYETVGRKRCAVTGGEVWDEVKLVIPDRAENGERVVEISDGAFARREDVRSAQLGGCLEKIGGSAFAYCENLRAVFIGDGVCEIGKGAFRGCDKLEYVEIAESVREIGAEAFWSCGKFSVNYKGKREKWLKFAASGAFAETGIYTVRCSDGLIRYRNDEDNENEFDYLTLNGSLRNVKHIGEPNVRIPETIGGRKVLVIGKFAFAKNQKIESLSIPKTVEKVDDKAFSEMPRLKTVEIAKGVMEIGNEAFCACSELSLVILPETLPRFGERVFRQCPKLKIRYMGDRATWEKAVRRVSELANVDVEFAD